MEPTRTEDALEQYRNEYLRLKSAVCDRITGLPAYTLLIDDLRTLLDVRRHVGVIHVEPVNLGIVESLYGWQAFDRTTAGLAEALLALPGRSVPGSARLAAGSVPADRFVVFVPDGPSGTEIDHAILAELAAAVKLKLDAALEQDAAAAALSPRLLVRTGYALLSEDPFYRFERRLHAAVDEARRLPERRAERRDLAWGEELRKMIREARVRTLWQPVVDLASGAIVGFEALSRGPADSLFEMPRAMFALSGRVGASGELDRLCHESAFREAAGFAPAGKLFVNVLPETLADPKFSGGAMRDLAVATGRKPADVVVEISERAVGGATESCVAACAALRAGGFAIAIDDAGTGAAGATLIDRLKPDFVKVDASLVRGIDANLLKQEIFGSLVGAGSASGAAVVAVGVETAREAGVLRALGARYAQGYHFAAPEPRERWAP